jgi:hypothetical protein
MRVRRLLLTFLSAGAAAIAAASSLSSAPSNLEPSQPTPIRAVVELFTSQGCSSCPPADTLLKTLADDPSIMALTLPVDYWNYLGWKDTFASSRNSDRQRSYAKVRGDGSIYTPQVVINGISHVNGASKAEIENAIGMTSKTLGPDRIPVRFWQENNTLNIATGGARPGHPVEEATIWFGVVQTSGTVDVTQGENKGKSLTYTNIVRELTPIGLWKGQPMQIQIPRGAVMLAETQKSVVLIQEGRAGPIIGAAWAGLW